jgi:hypothetical protein
MSTPHCFHYIDLECRVDQTAPSIFYIADNLVTEDSEEWIHKSSTTLRSLFVFFFFVFVTAYDLFVEKVLGFFLVNLYVLTDDLDSAAVCF